MPHSHGTRKAGSANIDKPVLMPSGGMTMARVVTGRCVSRMRHSSTATNPMTPARSGPYGISKTFMVR
jgi:hypothetical protein